LFSKKAFDEPPRYSGGAVGKEGLGEYKARGYLPSESGGEVVSRTLDYGFSDFSTALAFLYIAQNLKEKLPAEPNPDMVKADLITKAKDLYRRANNAYRSSFDSSRGLMVPRNRNGDFSQRFSANEWGNGFTEGNAWHHSFPGYSIICPFLDLNNDFLKAAKQNSPEINDVFDCKNGLISLYNNRAKDLLNKLQELVGSQSRFQVGSYGQEIHEMTESVTLAMGQVIMFSSFFFFSLSSFLSFVRSL
jgi:hypothetical protein